MKLTADYQPKGVAMVAISSNSTATHPQDGPEKMSEDAKQYGVTCSPHVFSSSFRHPGSVESHANDTSPLLPLASRRLHISLSV